jgi:hypothetical protein
MKRRVLARVVGLSLSSLLGLAATAHAQDKALADRAAGLARNEGAVEIEPALRLTGSGFSLEHRMKVEGGYCYVAALSWTSSSTTMLSVGFERRPDGQPVNDSFAVVTGRFAPPGGAKRFCANRSGSVLLTLTSLAPNGTIDINGHYDHVLVIGRAKEGKAAAAQRDSDEKARAGQITAQMNANIAAAEAKKKREQERRCRECSEDFRLCQVEAAERRRHPPPGVHFVTSCEEQYRECGFGLKADALSHPQEWPCSLPR